ncbi:MAG TPA: undecaprenyl-diphosphate phosphatase [Dehalococcoidia bacterium]|nr:undecaprenyl-diphosphate phosphatase [Dehalococcoidia bacterium]
MTDVLQALVLGVIQGLTEFLPISSTGHLIIAEKALGMSRDEFGLRFDAAIHLGTLAAVLVYFRDTWLSLIAAWFESLRSRRWDATPQSKLAWLLILGTIPAGLAGLALESTAEDTFRSPALVAAMMIIFCVPLLLAERYGSRAREQAEASPIDALILGAAQSIALIPGVSRSGITISAGMLRGFNRESAAVLAFLLSAPIIAAAGGKQLLDIARGSAEASTVDNELAVYATGLITAAIVGFASIALLLKYLRFNSLAVFVAYRVIAGIVILGLGAAGAL